MIGRVMPGSRRLDLVVLGCALALSALGILFIDSATTGTRYEGLASRQAIWIAVGLGAMIVALLFDYRMLLKFSFAIYCASLLPLVYLLFFGERIANVPLVDPGRASSSSSRPSSRRSRRPCSWPTSSRTRTTRGSKPRRSSSSRAIVGVPRSWCSSSPTWASR